MMRMNKEKVTPKCWQPCVSYEGKRTWGEGETGSCVNSERWDQPLPETWTIQLHELVKFMYIFSHFE